MPAWTDKDRRQYEHIKDGALDQGRTEDRAEEVAARTVNKQRREAGRTPSRRTSGTGDPTSRLEARSRDELYNRAQELEIAGRSDMDKAELIDAIRSANG